MSERRAKFQSFLRRFNPTGTLAAIEQGLAVRPPGGLADRLCTSLELEPTESHLIIGGIGSGKTTILHQVRASLIDSGAAEAMVVDLPSVHSLNAPRSGVLLATVGKFLCRAIESSGQNTAVDDEVKRLREIAHGAWVSNDELNGSPDIDSDFEDGTWVKGILQAPKAPPEVQELQRLIRRIVRVFDVPPVVCVDGMDRLSDGVAFNRFVRWDLRALHEAGVGVVIVGPHALAMAQFEPVHGRFDRWYLVGAVPVQDRAAWALLAAVLAKRDEDGLLEPAAADRLIELSGGLMRDLINLTRSAGEVAYGAGAERISVEHVNEAAGRFGRALLLGVSPEQAKRLRDFVEVPRSGPDRAPRGKVLHFTLATDLDLSLLLARLIIEVEEAPPRYIPHPTIVALVPGLPQ